MYPSPDQPISIKLINRLGRLLAALHIRQPSLSIDKLLAKASSTTGLSDFGDPSYREGLEVLLESLEKEANLSQMGRIIAKGLVVENLITRLQVVDYRKQRPEICDRPIVKPLIVVGLPRTGTTILFELLAQDPSMRYPLTWEISKPMPPVQPATFDNDPRIDEVDKTLALTDQLAPGFKAIHEVGARLPQECISILAPHFVSEQFPCSFRVPSFRTWNLNNDMQPAYQWHQYFLQHMQADYMKDRWLLKSPAHIGCLDALMAQYPDACIVQTHRDPMDVIGSVSSLACTLRSASSDMVDPVRTGQEEAEHFAELLRRGMSQREALNKESQFFDMQFQDIITDPLSIIRAMYEHFNFDFSQQTADAMQRYLDNRPREKHGKHNYTLEQFGLSKEKHGHLFEQYCEKYIN